MALETFIERRAGWLRTLLVQSDAWRPHIRVGMLVITAVVIAALMPGSGIRQHSVEVGRRWQQPDLIASVDFPLRKDANALARERQQAQANVPDAFLLEPEVAAEARQAMADYFLRLEQTLAAYSPLLRRAGADSARHWLSDELGRLEPALSADEGLALLTEPQRLTALRVAAQGVADAAYRAGYIDRDRGQSRRTYVSLRATESREQLIDAQQVADAATVSTRQAELTRALPPPDARLVAQLVAAHIRPNYRHSEALIEADRAAALRAVSPHTGLVRAGQLIVARNQRITPEIELAVRSYYQAQARLEGSESPGLTFMGQLALVSLLLLVTAVFLRTNRRELWGRNRKVALLLFTFVLMTALNALVIAIGPLGGFSISPTFLVPMSMAPIMLTVFFDDRVGFFANIIIALLAGLILYNSFEFFFIQVVAGSVAVSGLTILRRRSQIFTTAGSLLLAYWGAYLAYNLALRGSFAEIPYGNLVLFALNVLITLGTYPLIYFFERLFGITSDLTYLELLDTDHPLLKELSLKAPGTYQHSLQVANIAEHVATQIGANALQVRVGALFHDIGKVYQPDFFVENQKAGYNPHERMEAQLSAEIIINHVEYGIELARKHNLPAEIVDFIRTHHGTSRVEHFYRSYARAHPEDTAEGDFRYKGPQPRTKEQAILMLADSCEAASRSLSTYTADHLRGLTEAVISHKITDGQLTQARITFRDVDTIRLEIIAILSTIYHSRLSTALPEQASAGASLSDGAQVVAAAPAQIDA